MIIEDLLFVVTQMTADAPATPTPTQAPTVLETTDMIVGIVGTALSALALLVGGGWAYFRFVRGRTFRKRADVTIAGGWAAVEDAKWLHVLVTVKNTSGVKLEPVQKGTGLAINTMSVDDKGTVTWSRGRVTPILEDHAWLEPGDTVTDDRIPPVTIDFTGKPVQAHVRIVWKRWPKNATLDVKHIIWPHDSEPKSTTRE